jgi:hypothetical protein
MMRVATRRRNARSCVTNRQRFASVDQKVLQPLDRAQVEVIGGLIEQEHIGIANEGARKQRLALAAADASPNDKSASRPKCERTVSTRV